MSHTTYTSAFVSGLEAVIVYYDGDFDGDLDQTKTVDIVFVPDLGQGPSVTWFTKLPVMPLVAKCFDKDKNEVHCHTIDGKPEKVNVPALLIQFKTPPVNRLASTSGNPGCLGKLLKTFKLRTYDDPPVSIGGTGTLNGTLSKDGRPPNTQVPADFSIPIIVYSGN